MSADRTTGEHPILTVADARPRCNADCPSRRDDDEPAIERRSGHVSIPSRWLWPALVLLLTGNGAGAAKLLGLIPDVTTAQAAPDPRIAQLERRADSIDNSIASLNASAARVERNLIRIAERLRVRDLERP